MFVLIIWKTKNNFAGDTVAGENKAKERSITVKVTITKLVQSKLKSVVSMCFWATNRVSALVAINKLNSVVPNPCTAKAASMDIEAASMAMYQPM
ncbi:hypothetical protein VCHA53O466_50470 [Vibrio chagasii]|nr:hypothetical protein VCHA53O466_50470 [Vibrio chagasii]